MSFSRRLRLCCVFLAAVVSIFLMSTSFLPQSTGGPHTYVADIFCAPSAESIHCQGKSSGAKIGNPCLNTPMDCLLSDSDVKPKFVKLYGASEYSRPNPLWQFQGLFVGESFRASILRVSLLNSVLTVLIACMGVYLLRCREQRRAAIPIFCSLCLIPALFFQIGGLYPASLGMIAFLTFLLCLVQISDTTVENATPRWRLIGITVFSTFLLSTTRFDYWVFGMISTLVFVALLVLRNRRTLSTNTLKPLGSFLLVIAVFLVQIPLGQTNTQRLSLAVGGKLELSELPEQQALLAQGIIQNGGVLQRLRYAVTAPVYYFEDFVDMTEISFPQYLLYLFTILISVLILVIFVHSLRKIEYRSVFAQVGGVLVLGAVLMPAYVQTGHVRLRYVAPLILGAVLLACISGKKQSSTLVMWTRAPISFAVWGVPVLFLILLIRQQKTVWEALSIPAVVVITTYGMCHLFLVSTILSLEHSKTASSSH